MSKNKNIEELRKDSEKIRLFFSELQASGAVNTQKDLWEKINYYWDRENTPPVSYQTFNKYFNFCNKAEYDQAINELTMSIILSTLEKIPLIPNLIDESKNDLTKSNVLNSTTIVQGVNYFLGMKKHIDKCFVRWSNQVWQYDKYIVKSALIEDVLFIEGNIRVYGTFKVRRLWGLLYRVSVQFRADIKIEDEKMRITYLSFTDNKWSWVNQTGFVEDISLWEEAIIFL